LRRCRCSVPRLLLAALLVVAWAALLPRDGLARSSASEPSSPAADIRSQNGNDRDTGEALRDVLAVGAALLLLTGGLVGGLALWYVRGRDPHMGLVADILPEPPDDLPPGAAGTLLDERADHCDVVATLVDLGHRSILSITEVPVGPDGRRGGRDFTVVLARTGAALAPFEAELLRVLFGRDPVRGAATSLGAVKDRFDRAQPVIKRRLYGELVRHRYFRRSPDDTRRRYRRLGWWVTGIALIGGVVATVTVGGLVWLPAVVLAGEGAVMARMARAMPRKTRRGAEAAARWAAFRRYLADLARYDQAKVQTARTAFDRYLPYAVAFGLDRDFVRAFANVEVPAPSWYHRVRGGRVGGGDVHLDPAFDIDVDPGTGLEIAHLATLVGEASGGWPGMPDLPLPGVPDLSGFSGMPDVPSVSLQGLSDVSGETLGAVSDGFLGLLDAAGSIFEAFDLDL
jgi:Predicted membrane protein (DUF2207)